MKHIKLRLLAMLLAGVLGGCDIDIPPASSVSYVTYTDGKPGNRVVLDPAQVDALTEWLSRYRSGWSLDFAAHPPATYIMVAHNTGEVSMLNLWRDRLIIHGALGSYERPLTPDELGELGRILQISAVIPVMPDE